MIPSNLQIGDYIFVAKAERKREMLREHVKKYLPYETIQRFMVGNIGRVLNGKLESWLSGNSILELIAGFVEDNKEFSVATLLPTDRILKVNSIENINKYLDDLSKDYTINIKALRKKAEKDYNRLNELSLDENVWRRYWLRF